VDLELWDQDEAHESLVTWPRLQALGLSPERDQQPPLPLPLPDNHSVAEVVATIGVYRDSLRVSAARFLHFAAEAGHDLQLRLDFFSQSKAYATAADQLDITLTTLYSGQARYQAYLNQVGTCLQHIVIPPDLQNVTLQLAATDRQEA
jgi:hypothetical protein